MGYCSRNVKLFDALSDVLLKRLVLVLRFNSITVRESCSIRRKMWEVDAGFMVIKNNLARIAFSKFGFSFLSDFLSGPVALAYCDGDVPSFLRLIFEISNLYSDERFSVLSGKCDKQLFSRERMSFVSSFSSEAFVYLDLACALNSTSSSLVHLINRPAALLTSYLESYSSTVDSCNN